MPRRNAKKRTTRIVTTVAKSVPRVRPARRPRRVPRPPSNDYLRSLNDPDSCVGCKIPDPFTCVPTGTFRLSADLSIAPSTATITGLEFDPFSMSYRTANTLNADTTINWFSQVDLPGASNARVVYASWRPVSAYIQVLFAGSTSSDSGVASGYWYQPTAVAPISTVSNAVSLARNRIVMVREGLRVCYLPADNSSVEFGRNTSFGGFGTNAIFGPRIGYVSSGQTVGAALQVRIVCNYEGVASSDTSDFITATPSPSNMSNFTEAMQWGQRQLNTVKTIKEAWDQGRTTLTAAQGLLMTAQSSMAMTAARTIARRIRN